MEWEYYRLHLWSPSFHCFLYQKFQELHKVRARLLSISLMFLLAIWPSMNNKNQQNQKQLLFFQILQRTLKKSFMNFSHSSEISYSGYVFVKNSSQTASGTFSVNREIGLRSIISLWHRLIKWKTSKSNYFKLMQTTSDSTHSKKFSHSLRYSSKISSKSTPSTISAVLSTLPTIDSVASLKLFPEPELIRKYVNLMANL